MGVDEVPLGCSGLLRVAGLPVRFWLAGASPALFEKAAQLEHLEKMRRVDATRLAERIGERLVPIRQLSRGERAFLLDVRRRLHRGDLIGEMAREHLRETAGLSDADGDLVRAVVAMIDRDRQIDILSGEVADEIALEQDRLLLLPDEIRRESRVAEAQLAPESPESPRAAGKPSRKSRRHRSEHQWRRVTRGATASTPRGWLSHVALLPVEATADVVPLALTDRFTAQWTENVRARSLALKRPPEHWPAHDTSLAVNPLRWDADGRLRCVAQDANGGHAQIAVRHTPLLDVVLAQLADATQTFGWLAERLGCVERHEWLTLRGFVRHLVVLGVLQASSPPRVRFERQATPRRSTNPAGGDGDPGGWVDVYRYAASSLSAACAGNAQRGVSDVLRILDLFRAAMSANDRGLGWTSKRSASLTEIITAELSAHEAPRSGPEATDSAHRTAFTASPTSGFVKLVSTIAARTGDPEEFVIGPSLLDACDAPSGPLTWPVDCLLRVPSQTDGFTAVLDQIWPPGMLDARFLDTLVDIHGIVPHMEMYRAFLREVEQLTGVLFVELLLPPLHDEAANAVRRPVYTRAWTGDPHTAAYIRRGRDPGHYIPLHAIHLRHVDDGLRADVAGRPLWPLYHATRSFSPPWDRLATLLLATAPLHLPWDFNSMMHTLLRELRQTAVPRIAVSGGIVLSPARWRVSPEDTWDQSAPVAAKIRSLIRLRNRYSLPRWVYVERTDGKPPVACDLESLYSIRMIERLTEHDAPLRLIEMLPTPDEFPVTDHAHDRGDRLAAQLHLRFPCDESPSAMATRVAPAVLAALHQPNLVPDGARASVGARDPPSGGRSTLGRHRRDSSAQASTI